MFIAVLSWFLSDEKCSEIYKTLDSKIKLDKVWHSLIKVGNNYWRGEVWRNKCLGDHNPSVLFQIVLFLNGKYFVLRRGQEHRNLKRQQGIMEIKVNGILYIKYVE